MENTRYFKQFSDMISNQEFDEQSMDYSGMDRHILFLKQLATVENSSVAVLDLFRQKYLFLQSKFLPLLGVELNEVLQKGQRYFYSLMHPDDIGFVIETHKRTFQFQMQLPPEERKKYKSIYDFRLKGKNGDYIRFIQQVMPLELDGKGNIWLMLTVNDIVPGGGGLTKQQRRLVHIETGKLYLFNEEDETNAKTILSKREIEVLGLLSKGLASKHIAEELYLSVNTINNHRRRILEKTNMDSTAGAVRYAISLGLM